jgi:hypothetical protein
MLQGMRTTRRGRGSLPLEPKQSQLIPDRRPLHRRIYIRSSWCPLVELSGIVEALDGKSPMKILVWDTTRRLSVDNAVVQVHPR